MSKYTIRVGSDDCAESPEDWSEWKLYSFHRDSRVNPSEWLNCDGTGATSEIAEQLESGSAFILSCYQHGQVQWGLVGEVHQCRWDTAQVAGILVWEGEEPLTGDYKTRQSNARNFLSEYTSWANGEVYYVTIEGEDGEVLDSCGGFIGWSAVEEYAKEQAEAIRGNDEGAEFVCPDSQEEFWN